jgi:hypothetical protein
MTTIDIIAALPSLKPNELKAVQIALEKLMAPSQMDHELFQAVLDVLGVSGSVKVFSQTQAYKVWLKNQSAVSMLISKITAAQKPKRVVLIHLKRFLMELLISSLKENQLELTMRNIANHLAFIEEVFEKSFPDYLANNLAYLLISKLPTQET